MDRRLILSDLACQVLPNAKVLGPPSYKIVWTDKPSGDAANGLLPSLFCSQEVYFNAAREIEASLDWRSYQYALFKRNHRTDLRQISG